MRKNNENRWMVGGENIRAMGKYHRNRKKTEYNQNRQSTVAKY